MKFVAKSLGYLILLIILLLAVVLLSLRFRPDWVIAGVNKVQSAAQIDVSGLQVTLLPPSVAAEQLDVAMAAQDVSVQAASAQLNPSAWWSDTPFWQIDIDRVQVDQHPGQPEAPSAEPSSSIGVLNIMPYLTFKQIEIGEVVVTGDSPVTAQLQAQQDGRDINIKASGEAAGNQFNLTGTMARSDSDLNFDLKLNSDPSDAAGIEAKAELKGVLASSKRLQLNVESGSMQVVIDEQTHQLQNLVGQLAVNPDKSGDELAFDDFGGDYLGPDWKEPLDFAATGTVSQRANTLQVDLKANAGQSQVQIATTPGAGPGAWQGNVDVQSEGLHPSIDIAPYAAADVFPLTLVSKVKVAGSEITLADLKLDSPENKLVGDVLLDTAEPLRLVAKIVADQLYVPLLEASEETEATAEETVASAEPVAAEDEDQPAADAATDEESAEESEQEVVFSTEPIDWSWLEVAEIDVNLSAAKLRLQEALFESLAIEARNESGTLTAKPLSAKLGDGGFSGEMTLALLGKGAAPAPAEDAAPEATRPVKAAARFEMNGIALESFGFVPQEELKGGALEVDLKLDAEGLSAHELASSLGGDILVMVQEATLMNDFIELAGSDLLMETLNKLNPFAKEDPTTELNCALIHFSAEDGQLKTEKELVLETSKMEIIGNGSIDLDKEQLDITFEPNAKSGVGINVGSLVKFLKLGGTLASPSPAADAGGLLKSGLAIGAAISTGGASVLAEGLAKRVMNAGSACENFRKGPAAAPKASAAADS